MVHRQQSSIPKVRNLGKVVFCNFSKPLKLSDNDKMIVEENLERDKYLQECEARDLIEFGMIPEFIGR